MPLYRITFILEGRTITTLRNVPHALDDYYQEVLMKLNHRYGYGRIKHFDLVQLSRYSTEAKELNAIITPANSEDAGVVARRMIRPHPHPDSNRPGDGQGNR